jgi:micrococcal nuclease
MTRSRIQALALAATAVGAVLVVATKCGSVQDSTGTKVAAAPAETDYSPGDHYVDHVVDGDTLWLRKNDKTIKVRLLRVDAPELGEFGFDEAKDELQRQLGDESAIRLEFEEERTDVHGRTLAYLIIDGKNVNVEMVRSGWSPYFDRYGKGRYEAQFADAQSHAKSERLGIWGNR